MKRREFLGCLSATAAATAAWPVVARAQQGTVQRVGYIWIGAPGTDVSSAGLRQGLIDRGYAIGRNLLLEERYAEGQPERIPALIADLLASKVDVLVTVGTPITRAAQHATTTVPIVFMSGDPVGAGLVTSLSHPGGNLTGMSLLSNDYSAKWLELLTRAAPALHRVAVLWNPDNPGTVGQLNHLRETAPVLGLELTILDAQPSHIETNMAALTPQMIDGFVVTDDPLFLPLLPRLIALAADRRLPALYGFSAAVKQGGLMSYSANFFAMWRGLASYVDRILKGDHPSDLPVEQATEVSLQINVKTAKALGLTIPQTLLATADEVIE
jgi:putative ABC transport system substrate-binding protein